MRFNQSLNDTLRGFVMAGPAFSVKVGTGATLDGVTGTSDFDIDPAIGSRDFGLAFAGGLEWREVPRRSALRAGPDGRRHRHLRPRRRTAESDVQHHGRIAAALDRLGSKPAPLSSGAVGQTDPPNVPGSDRTSAVQLRRSQWANWAFPANIRTPAASSRPCTAAGSGRCGSTRGSGPPRSRTPAIGTSWRRGVTGLSVAFDLPTQMGYDSDHSAGRR